MPSIRLGNVAPLEAQVGTTVTVNDKETASAGSVPLPGVQEETLIVVSGGSLSDQLQQVDVVWKLHSSASPAWVSGDDEFFVEAVARSFDCPVGKPDGWGELEDEAEPVQDEETE